MDFKNILLDIGYSNIKDNGRELRMKPIYRDSNNETALSVRKDTGHFIDFGRSLSGSFEYLVQMSLGLKSIIEAKEQLKNKWSITEVKREHRPTISGVRVFPKEFLTKIIPNHDYWIDRGVSLETLSIFEGGVVKDGTMANRYVFPIFDSKRNLIGVTGRYIKPLLNKNIPKWLHKGRVSEWKYPLQKNYEVVKSKKEIILIESVGDMLSLWEAGIKNTLIIFGLNLSPSVVSLLIKLDPEKIYIAFNNDSDNNSAGNKAANKVMKKLSLYFDPHQVRVALPDKNDFGDMTREEVLEWGKKYDR